MADNPLVALFTRKREPPLDDRAMAVSPTLSTADIDAIRIRAAHVITPAYHRAVATTIFSRDANVLARNDCKMLARARASPSVAMSIDAVRLAIGIGAYIDAFRRTYNELLRTTAPTLTANLAVLSTLTSALGADDGQVMLAIDAVYADNGSPFYSFTTQERDAARARALLDIDSDLMLVCLCLHTTASYDGITHEPGVVVQAIDSGRLDITIDAMADLLRRL